jgi:hypothetical protein
MRNPDSTMDSFKRLLELAPPPPSPVDAGSPEGWPDIEHALGSPLPSDYKRLINTYGSGEFCDLLWVLNPFTKKPNDLLSQIEPILEVYEDGRDSWSAKCPFPAFPKPGGLLPFGGDSNGGNIFWITDGPPEHWPLVVYNWRGGCDSERHEMPLVDFLVGWLTGEIPNCFFGVGIDSPIIKRDPVFCPSGIVRESQRLGSDGTPPFGSEEGCWFSHVFHLSSLKCGRCGAVRDCSSDLDLATIPHIPAEEFGALIEERTGRTIERARTEGWRLVGYPEEPKFLCPACSIDEKRIEA